MLATEASNSRYFFFYFDISHPTTRPKSSKTVGRTTFSKSKKEDKEILCYSWKKRPLQTTWTGGQLTQIALMAPIWKNNRTIKVYSILRVQPGTQLKA
jgi:hypothetical protein